MNFTSPAELVRQARYLSDKNQQEFGALLGKDQSLISRYERGRSVPPTEVTMHCMHILNAATPSKEEVSLETLLTTIRQRLAAPSHARARALLFELLNELTAPRNA
ncbi:helix-turn-helix domain-containing protein [Crenobacter cavernae]|uniref:XRE family transcriptional regulator n=1 Tax=Crenobacter cavernae TaxID=2290923 RepID=A0A345Y3B2_9NEIS|nr:helix-turn-helix transcriptional regulator [Crenobacter cavernae]AXK38414.1 XRE family transcriptional regulator [Crenobacter cavernae]